jgi:GT2 family glycosyltransferase
VSSASTVRLFEGRVSSASTIGLFEGRVSSASTVRLSEGRVSSASTVRLLGQAGLAAYLTGAMTPTVTAIVVSFAQPASTRKAICSLLEQSLAPTEVLVVDNDPGGATMGLLAEEQQMHAVRTIHPGVNLGYTRAANLAARQASGDWLFFLNPDAVAREDCLLQLAQAVDGPDVAVVGAQVLLPDGRTNAGDNPVNIVGVSWSGGYRHPREHGPARDTAAVSGAAVMVRREIFAGLGGLCPHFFMYVDDTDFAWRVRVSGRRVRYCPEAVVVHDYVFESGAHKWFYLERNRLWALLCNLQLGTLALLFPALLAAEAAIVKRAISERWLGEKVRAWASLARHAPELARWRRSVQATRSVSDYRVLLMFVGGIQTQLIDTRLPRWVNPCMERYRRLLLKALARREG